MKRKKCCGLTAWIAALIIILIGCVISKEPGKKMTLMVYMIGSDLEEGAGLASADIQEMLKADLRPGVNLYLMTGGSREWKNEIAPEKLTTYRITNHKMQVVEQSVLADMSDPKTLSLFLTNVYEYENGKGHYALILWDHGMGPMEGFGLDTLHQGHSMKLSDLSTAFEESPFGRENRLYWLGFDACLMATIETASAVCDYTDYLLASQEAEPKYGWDYQFISLLSPDQNQEEQMKYAGTAFMDYYERLCKNQPNYKPVRTLSSLNLREVGQVSRLLEDVFRKVDKYEIDIRVGDYIRKRAKAVNIGRFSTGVNYDLIDLKILAEIIGEADKRAGSTLSEFVDDLVVDNWSNVDYTCGISLYSPYDNLDEYENNWQSIFKDITISDAYYVFVNQMIHDAQNGNGTCFEREMIPYVTCLADGYRIRLTLDEEQQENYAGSRIWIFTEDALTNKLSETDNDRLILRLAYSTDLSENNRGTIETSYNGRLICAIDSENKKHDIFAMSPDRDRYLCYCNLLNGEKDYQNTWLQLKNVETGLEVIGAVANGEENENFDQLYARGKEELDLNMWETMEVVSLIYSVRENGEALDTETVYYSQYPIEGENIKMEWNEEQGETYAMFVITDLAGNTHESKIVPLR